MQSSRRYPRTVAIHIAALACVALIALTGYLSANAAENGQSTEDRDALYAELAQEARAAERQFNLLKQVVRVVRPTVVHIETSRNSNGSSGRERTVEEAGSGVIIQMQGKHYVLTNRHVIKDHVSLEDIRVRLADGRQLHPMMVWSDRGTDIAVLAINAPDLTSGRLGDSSQLEIGDFVLAVGSPFGLSHSVTFGIISAKGRRDLKLGDDGVRYQDFLQTDAAINPGNSGGPLINLRGEVIGINTAIASNSGGNEGIGFTIPINMAMAVAGQLIDNGFVRRAFLGVHLDSRFNAEVAARMGLPRPQGARVTGITPDSPAEAAGLKTDDVILRFDGTRIEDDSHLVNRVSLTPVDKEVEIVIFREGKSETIKVKVGQRSDANQ